MKRAEALPSTLNRFPTRCCNVAYVKHTAIHTTPKAHLKYILNPEKNEKMKYVTGICCGDDLETAYDNFKEIFEKYNDEKFDDCNSSKKS